MKKEEILILMINSINDDNREMAERSNMDKELYEKMFDESQPSLQFMISNMYDKLEAAGVLKS
jgi:hypothetical protein